MHSRRSPANPGILICIVRVELLGPSYFYSISLRKHENRHNYCYVASYNELDELDDLVFELDDLGVLVFELDDLGVLVFELDDLGVLVFELDDLGVLVVELDELDDLGVLRRRPSDELDDLGSLGLLVLSLGLLVFELEEGPLVLSLGLLVFELEEGPLVFLRRLPRLSSCFLRLSSHVSWPCVGSWARRRPLVSTGTALWASSGFLARRRLMSPSAATGAGSRTATRATRREAAAAKRVIFIYMLLV